METQSYGEAAAGAKTFTSALAPGPPGLATGQLPGLLIGHKSMSTVRNVGVGVGVGVGVDVDAHVIVDGDGDGDGDAYDDSNGNGRCLQPKDFAR